MLARTQSRFHDVRVRLENHVPRTAARRFLWEFFLFGFKEGWACLFGATLLALLLLTKWLWPAGIAFARYDFLFLSALAIQAMLLLWRMETVREAQIIFIFHVIGTVMELFKTNVGSWTYPEPSIFHIGHVPLFSGFMYASIGSYLARITRIFDLHYSRYPDRRLAVLLAGLIYVNFFTHHYLPDIRILLFLLTAIAFGPTWVHYRPSGHGAACRYCSALASSPFSSGPPKTSAPSRRSGFTRTRRMAGNWCAPASTGRGSC